jgi:hypothetical protein
MLPNLEPIEALHPHLGLLSPQPNKKEQCNLYILHSVALRLRKKENPVKKIKPTI